MDLSLEIGKNVYNARVSSLLMYNGRLIMDYGSQFVFPIGGRIQYGETMLTALRREISEELSVTIESEKLIGIAEQSFYSDYQKNTLHEHNFIFSCTLMSEPKGHFKYFDTLEKTAYHPPYWLQLQDRFIHTNIDGSVFEKLDISKKVGDLGEFNVRISAIIRDKDKILFDQSAYDEKHKVLIGGRMMMGESFEQALAREVREELGVDIIKLRFCGIGEDFFDLKINASSEKNIHFISFVYEVDVDLDAIRFDDGCEGIWLRKDDLGPLHMSSVLQYL